jgi:hypothetical protein
VLWHPTFGGEVDRLRDFEVADVTGDGVEDIVIATHDQGVVAVLAWNGNAYQLHELCRTRNTFVHEIELGDVDGDGRSEIFATPSQPNKLDGSIQTGEIAMFKFAEGKWHHRTVDKLATRHAKEILCVTLAGESKAVLFSSLEGERMTSDHLSDSTAIRLYRFESDPPTAQDIASISGRLCRFLTFGDTDGDGRGELIVSTERSGIWKLTPEAGAWKKQLIAVETSGFEHATYLRDLNGDGVDEIYVASDEQQELRCYWFNGIDYSVEVIGKLLEGVITFNITTL